MACRTITTPIAASIRIGARGAIAPRVRRHSSTQTEKRQHRQDHDDEANEVDHSIHAYLLASALHTADPQPLTGHIVASSLSVGGGFSIRRRIRQECREKSVDVSL